MSASSAGTLNLTQPDVLGRATCRGRALTCTRSHALHNAINLGSLALVLALVPPIFLAARALPLWLGPLVAAPLLGTAIFALFTLVVHEASHQQFLLCRSPRFRHLLNDLPGWAVCLLFLRDYGLHWRTGHLIHHQRPLEDDDPQNCAKYVLEGRALRRKLAKTFLVPFYELELYRLWLPELDDRCPKPGRIGPSREGWRAAAFLFGWAAILFFPVQEAPVFTLLTLFLSFKYAQALNVLKSSFEHGGGYTEIADVRLRTRGLTFPGMNLLFPFCITPYHFEHHLLPKVPWYRLPRLRRELLPKLPKDAREQAYTPPSRLVQRILLSDR